MLVLITYDVEVVTPAGAKRLRRVAKACQNHGQRVQNSVFECVLDSATFTRLKADIEAIIDPEKDSIRFYFLGNNWERKVESIGKVTSYNVTAELII
jgi:CRISPR-associated protein Cas2